MAYCQKRTLDLSYSVKARLDLVYFGFQQPSRNSIRHTRYTSSEKRLVIWLQLVTLSLATSHGTLPEDTIDVYITMHMLKVSIHSGKIRPCKYLSILHREWELKLFPSLRKEDERLYWRMPSRIQSLHLLILSHLAQSLTICKAAQSHPNEEKCHGYQV